MQRDAAPASAPHIACMQGPMGGLSVLSAAPLFGVPRLSLLLVMAVCFATLILNEANGGTPNRTRDDEELSFEEGARARLTSV